MALRSGHPHNLRGGCVRWHRERGVPFRPREKDWQGLEILPKEGVGSPRPGTRAGKPRVRLAEVGVVGAPFTFHSLFHCKLFLGTSGRDLKFSLGDIEKSIDI